MGRDKQSDKDILMDNVGDNEQLKAALIIIVAMSTGNMKPRDSYDDSIGITGKGSEPVECEDREDSDSIVRKCSDLWVAPSVERCYADALRARNQSSKQGNGRIY